MSTETKDKPAKPKTQEQLKAEHKAKMKAAINEIEKAVNAGFSFSIKNPFQQIRDAAVQFNDEKEALEALEKNLKKDKDPK
jgi:hypothetical protein